MGRPKRRQREIDQRRMEILQSASRVFAQKGFAAASMHEIAADVGYSTSSLYAYFENKQSILDAVVEALSASTVDLFDVVIPAGLTLRQRLELLLHHQYDWIEAHRDAVLFVLGSHGAATLSTEGAASDILDVLQQKMVAWFEENADPALLARVGPLDAATALMGLSQSFFLRWVRAGGQGSPRQHIPLVLDLFLHGFLDGGPR